MSAEPLVSIVLPTHNRANLLPKSIDSVLAQTYSHWELIVVDDGSNDATLEVVGKYNDPRIHCVSQVNRGLPGARNTGIAMARGQYLAFLDADDAYHAEKLKWHVEHLETEPEVGLSYASRVEVDGEGKPCWLLRAPRQVKLVNLGLSLVASGTVCSEEDLLELAGKTKTRTIAVSVVKRAMAEKRSAPGSQGGVNTSRS